MVTTNHCEILFTPDFPTLLTLSLHVDPQDRAHHLLMRGPDVLRDDRSRGFDVIWRRRPAGAVLPEDMHSGDRQVAERQGEAMLSGLFTLLERRPDTFWRPTGSSLRSVAAIAKGWRLRRPRETKSSNVSATSISGSVSEVP